METVGGHSARICELTRTRGNYEKARLPFSFTGRWDRLVPQRSETARHVFAGFVLQGVLPFFAKHDRRKLTVLFPPYSHGVSTLSQNRCEASRPRRRFGARAGSPSATASSPCLSDPIMRSASGASNRSTRLFDKASSPRHARGLKALAKVSRSLSGGLAGAKILNQVSPYMEVRDAWPANSHHLAADDREFQLVTWAKDRRLRLWPISEALTKVRLSNRISFSFLEDGD